MTLPEDHDPEPAEAKALTSAESRGPETLPSLPDQLSFLQPWKRALLATGGLLGLAAAVGGVAAMLPELGTGTASWWLVAGVAVASAWAGAVATRLAWRGTATIRPSHRLERLGVYLGIGGLALFCLLSGRGLETLALLLLIPLARWDMNRIDAGFTEEPPLLDE